MILFKQHSYNQGFTLLETVVYIALLSILLSAGIFNVYSLIQFFAVASTQNQNLMEVYFISLILNRYGNSISSISEPILGGSSQSFSIVSSRDQKTVNCTYRESMQELWCKDDSREVLLSKNIEKFSAHHIQNNATNSLLVVFTIGGEEYKFVFSVLP